MSPGHPGENTNWGGVAIDAERQIAVTNVNQIPTLVRLIARDQADSIIASGELRGWEVARQQGTPYVMARRVFLSPLPLPWRRR